MVKLLLKYMVGLIILGIIAIVILSAIANHLQKVAVEETLQSMNQGVLYSLSQQLQRYPKSQWPTRIKQLQPQYGNPASIVPLSALHLPSKKMQALLAGQLVITGGKEFYYFGYSIKELFSYSRIERSQYAIQLEEIPLSVLARRVCAWMVSLIALDLQQTPYPLWANKLKELEKTYAVPLSLLQLTDPTIPHPILSTLKHNDLALADTNHSGGKIQYTYFNLHQRHLILKIGPIAYPFYSEYSQYILLGIFIIISIFFIILLTFIFSRNLEKIYKITEQFSRGNFSIPTYFSQYSTLRTLYNNIIQMGNKIQGLIAAQRELTQLIAHECRTPISIMLFAIDRLEREKLSDSATMQVNNIKDELLDLNNLVTDFLTYARFTHQELPLNYESTLINPWMHRCVDKYKNAPLPVLFNSFAEENTLIEFDPNLMKRVIYNLVDNSLKHAHSKIQVSLELQKNQCMIHVDDDGVTLEENVKIAIFNPFVRLETTQNKEKTGFGLGLSIAESIVKRHQGNLTVTRSALGGTRFTISLPKAIALK